MKKLVITFAAMFAAVSLTAQVNGEMYVSGTLDLSTSSLVTATGNNTSTYPEGLSFGLSPEFGIFLIDRLELNAGLGYDLDRKPNSNTTDDGSSLYDIADQFNIQAGVNYHFRLADKFSYAPGIKFMLGFGSSMSQYTASEVSELYRNTAFTVRLSFVKFEFRPATHFAMTFEAGSIDFTTDTKTYKMGNSSYNLIEKKLDLGLNLGALIGFKYYL